MLIIDDATIAQGELKMFIVRDKLPPFEDVAGHVAQSVVAIAVGTRLDDGAPNIIGTGFALEWAEHFATCWHVAEKHDQIGRWSETQLKKAGLKDATLRLALRKGDDYVSAEIEPKTWFRGGDKTNDICIYRIIGVAVPPLNLYPEAGFPWGAEVGIIGFPLGNYLQGRMLRPFVLKTVIAGGFEMRVKIGGTTTETPRLALGTTVARGFSGGPVFLATDGQVVGMLASNTTIEISGISSPAGLSLAVHPASLKSVLESSLDTVIPVIKESLRKHLP